MKGGQRLQLSVRKATDAPNSSVAQRTDLGDLLPSWERGQLQH
ncbi:hypothetical protein CBM2589_U10173 [Cupriavidus taiwanensis]|uniref:Uncharacterized protein n=1 Tax=Cupriavidus taiwanensis TaxID=164546 RepID=A0A375CRE1_9BURK|nr:hypothetical protein CBM2589_U10173 [Cupriavidus taiwanensis]